MSGGPDACEAVWRRRTALGEWLRWAAVFAVTLLTVVCLMALVERHQGASVSGMWRAMRDLSYRMLPPDAGAVGHLWQPLLETIHMATLGTVLAFGVAVPVGFLAARNVMPFAPVRLVALAVIASSRSVNSLIWALLFVAIAGPGPIAGVLAVAMRSIGFIGKLFYEAVEEIDARPVEAIRATGAGPLQVFAWAIVPQVKPALAGITILRWDVNIRESTVVGLVGAGGIGLALKAAIDDGLAWQEVTTILLLILVLVLAGEALSARVRRKLT